MSLPVTLTSPNVLIAATDALAADCNENYDYTTDALNDTNTVVNALDAEITEARASFGDIDGRFDADELRITTIETTTIPATLAYAIQRANHTGTQSQSTVVNLVGDLAALDAKIDSTAFSTALPGQTPAVAGYYVQTDGTNASWVNIAPPLNIPLYQSQGGI